jgi:glycosyltransferase involved in cell wall biosynthesis
MRISFVTTAGAELASTRYRILIPAAELAKRHIVQVGPLPIHDADVVHFSKHWEKSDQESATLAKQRGQTVVFDVCDDYFDHRHQDHYKAMCALADVVTCPTPVLAARIHDVTGRKAVLIPDPYEYAEQPAKFAPTDPPRLLWFGHAANWDTMAPWLPHLKRFQLEIVSGCRPDHVDNLKLTVWNPMVMPGAFARADIVILPTERNTVKDAKSPNRLVESLRAGKVIVAGDHPAHAEFKDYVYIGDLLAGIDWAMAFPKLAAELARAGQSYVRERYSPAAIATCWESLIL